MPKAAPEPKRQTSLDTLEPYVADRVRQVLAGMKARNFDAMVFEARRTPERQQWLYGVGRTHSLRRKPVTYLDGVRNPSRHQVGKAVDIISRSRHWNAPEAFWRALTAESRKVGMYTLKWERCHTEWR